MIDVVDLYKSFPMGGRELVVLNNINLHIKRGELIAIMGASGAGKSTLLQILGTLDRPTKGTVSFDGPAPVELTRLDFSNASTPPTSCAFTAAMTAWPGWAVGPASAASPVWTRMAAARMERTPVWQVRQRRGAARHAGALVFISEFGE